MLRPVELRAQMGLLHQPLMMSVAIHQYVTLDE
jgi:hypothetical protein